MEHFIWFLGRFHVPRPAPALGILTLAAAFEILVQFRPFEDPSRGTLPALWAAGATQRDRNGGARLHARERGFASRTCRPWMAHRWAGMLRSAWRARLVAVLQDPSMEDHRRRVRRDIAILMILTGSPRRQPHPR